MWRPEDETRMRRALDLAGLGRGRVEPNPMVGCVIARDGRVIGEGWHTRFGAPHAEPVALAAAGEQARGASLYVTLEPCCHTNKKTPPCVPGIVAAGVARVVVGCLDPNPHVSGKGVAQLRAAGIDVEVGVLEAACRQFNAAFFAVQREQRPYVTLKWAQSRDGKVAGAGGHRTRISGDAAWALVHRLRARSDAILIGIGTALSDDPLLTTRGVDNPRPLTRLVLDSSLRLPLTSRLVASASEHPLRIYCDRSFLESAGNARAAELRRRRVEVVGVESVNGRLDLTQIIRQLGQERMTHVLVEGGPAVHRDAIERNLADRAWVIRSTASIDAADAPLAAKLDNRFVTTSIIQLDSDELTESLNTASPVCFLPAPSIDLPPARHGSC